MNNGYFIATAACSALVALAFVLIDRAAPRQAPRHAMALGVCLGMGASAISLMLLACGHGGLSMAAVLTTVVFAVWRSGR